MRGEAMRTLPDEDPTSLVREVRSLSDAGAVALKDCGMRPRRR
jgi:hypothetical protein